LLHAYSRALLLLRAARAQTKTSYSLYNKRVYNTIDYKLRTIEAENN